jgi:hypothetical protein
LEAREDDKSGKDPASFIYALRGLNPRAISHDGWGVTIRNRELKNVARELHPAALL